MDLKVKINITKVGGEGRCLEKKKIFISTYPSFSNIVRALSLHPLMPKTPVCKSNQQVFKNGIWGCVAGNNMLDRHRAQQLIRFS